MLYYNENIKKKYAMLFIFTNLTKNIYNGIQRDLYI